MSAADERIVAKDEDSSLFDILLGVPSRIAC
jgi:hypothetical protein